MENKQENNLEMDDGKASISEKIIEFIVFYLTANIVINMIFYFLFYTLSISIKTDGFSEFIAVNNLINVVVIIVDIVLICISINIFKKLYFQTICEKYKTLESALWVMTIIGVIIGFIISGLLNKELNLTGMNVHYIHYILMSALLIRASEQYSKICKNADLDEFRKKHNITRKTDWI